MKKLVPNLPAKFWNVSGILAALIVFLGAFSPALFAVDREVGSGKTFATISAALLAADPGDRVVVFSGTYDEKIAWTKAVDIIEAPGNTAVLKATDAIPGDAPIFLIDIILGSPVTVTWDGIDLINDSTKITRFFMERAGHEDAVVNLKNVSIADTPTASGHGRVITAETGTLSMENVFVNMNSTAGDPSGYEICVGAFGNNVAVSAKNCVFATPGGTVVHGEAPAEAATPPVMVFDTCVLSRKPGPNGFLTDLADASYTFNDCLFTAADSSTRGILTRGGSKQTVIELNRCRFDPNVQWRAIQTEKATKMTCKNCCFPSSGNEGFFMLHNNAQLSAGDTSDFTFTHCTFSFTVSGNVSGIRDEAVAGATVNYAVDNCLFYIPGSNSAHGAIHNNTQGGTVNVTGGTNYVYSESDPPSAGLLTGVIEPFLPADPKLSAIDLCHIADASSAAIDLAVTIGITDDVDKDVRGAKPDFGADEFTGTNIPPPEPPSRVVAFPGNGLVKLGWNPPSSGALAAAYNVFRTKPLPVAKLTNSPVTSLDLVVTPLQNDTEYCFKVRSVGIFGAESVDSPEVCATPAGGGGVVDLEVGTGKPFAKIQDAINAARGDGKDRVVVFTGDYDEALLIQKQVDIVEAPGQNAVLHIVSPLPALSFVLEFVGLGNYTVNWDGIDVQYDIDSGPRRMFLARFNNAGTVINIKNMAVRDLETSGGPDMRFFSNELAGAMNLENVTVDLLADTPDYTMIMSAHVGVAAITAKNCKFKGMIGGRLLYTELGKGVKLTADNCEFENLGRGAGGMIGHFTDGTVTLNDCVFKGDKANRGLFCNAGGKFQVLNVNRCVWDSKPSWVPVQFDKNVEAVFTNCCIPSNPNGDPAIPYSILLTDNIDVYGGSLMKLSLLQCTFSRTAENPESTAILFQRNDGNNMELTAQNNIFHLPGSTVGAVQVDPAALGTVDVIAGKNVRFIEPSGSAANDALETDPAGVIVNGSPNLLADLCHIEPPSSAFNAGSNVGVDIDIDGDLRPTEAGKVDLGADEFQGEAPPSCPIENLVCNVSDAVNLTWGIASGQQDACRCTRIEIRNGANGAVIQILAGNITNTSVPCDQLPGDGNLNVVCLGPDGSEKKLSCSFHCEKGIPFRRGDVEPNGDINATDAILILLYAFLGGAPGDCLEALDADGDGNINQTDAIVDLYFAFLGGSPPAEPFPGCATAAVIRHECKASNCQ